MGKNYKLADVFGGNSVMENAYHYHIALSEATPIDNDTYTLDVNGWLDSAEHDNLENYGTCDVRIKRPGEDWFTWTNDKNDYYESLPAGTQYSIEDIRPVGIHSYHGLYSGGANSLSGTLNSNTKIMLSFRTNNLASEYNSSFGDNFYAYIKCVGNGLYVSEQQTDKNVCAYVYGAAGANQLWYFERQSNNAYKVTSAATKYALDAVWPGGGTVGTAVWDGTDDQLWAIHINNGCCILSPVSSEQVADAGLVISDNYNNVYMLQELVDQGNRNQLFALEPVQLKIVYNSNGATTIKREGVPITEQTLSEMPRLVSPTEYLPDGLWNGNNPAWIYLERPGYTMDTHSWNTKADGTGISIDWDQVFDSGNDLANALGVDLSTGSKTVTLYMEWKPNTYTFTMDSNGGTGSINGFNVAYGGEFTIPTNTFQRAGYTSGGWYLKRNEDNKWYVGGKGWYTESEISANGYAKCVFGENSQHAINGGWIQGYGGSCTYTLHAVWTSNHLDVIYNPNGATSIKWKGESISEQALSKMPHIIYPAENQRNGLIDGNNPDSLFLERPGYTMETHSWNTKADGTGISVDWKQAFDTGNDLANALGVDLSAGSKTVTLYAEWKPNHLDIIYNSNGATSIKWKGEPISEQTLSEMPHIIYPTANQPDGLVDGNNPGSLFLERPGYTLETRCWNTKADGTGISVDWKQAFDTGNDLANALGLDLTTGSKTITLYAEWTANAYSFALDSNGGSGSMNGFTAIYNASFSIPSNAFSKTGYAFTGWYARRDSDNTWFVPDQGWLTEDEIAANGYAKCVYREQAQLVFNRYWTDGYDGVSSYTFFAVWRQMADGIDRTLEDGTYIIASASATDKSALAYLDIAGSAAAADPGTNVQIAGVYDPASFDTWTLTYQDGYYEIAQFGTNMVLEVANGSTDKGANVQVGARDGSDKQKWVVNFNWRDGCRIVSKVSGMSLDLQDGDTTSGTNVRQWTENNGSAESWFFIPYMPDQPVEEGRYVLLSRIADGWELDISYSNYGNVQLWNDTAQSKNNSFDVIKLSNGYYKLVNAALGKALAVEDGLSAIKCNVHLADDDGSLSQQWAIISTPTGYKLIARCSGMALDVADGAAADGTNIRQYNDNGSISHRWTFVAAEYTVAYDANGGSGAPEAQTKYYKTALALSSAVPVREGFTFLGWADRATSADADYQPGESYTSDANTVLYAIWQENAPAVVAVTEVSLSKTALIMAEGSSDTLIATVIPDDATDKTVTWTSSDDAIATVNDGTVTAVKAGTATITASAGDKSACCTVTVQAAPAPDPTAPQIVIEDLRVTQGETFTVPVVLKNNPGIAGFNLQLSYDTAMLELIDKAAGDFTGLQFSSLDAMPFRFNWDGGTEENTGTVAAVLTFRAKADAEGTTALELSFGNQELPYDALLTDIPFTAVGGEVEIRSFLPGDANGDGAITMKDSTTVRQHLAGWTVTLAEAAADANGDGAITMKDSTIIRQYLAGWPVTLGGAASGAKGRGTLRSSARFVPQIVVEDLSAAPGDTVSVPILLKNNPGIAGFDLAVSYDTTVLTLTGVTEGDFSGLQSGRLDAAPFQFNWDGGTEENAGTVAAVLTFRVSAGASGSTGISVSANHGTMPYDSALEDIAFEFRSAAVTVRAGGASIRSLSLRGGVASVELECLAKNAGVYCAAYAVGGRMLALLSSPVDGDGTYSFTFHETQIAYVKAFLLDGGAKPLCESMTAAAAGA